MSSATELGELLVAASRAFSQQGRTRFGEHGLSPARVRLLTTLHGRPGSRMRDLADVLGVSGRAITPLVDALEADGLVTRGPDPGDRRAFRLTLTEEGLGAIDEIGRLQHRISEEIFAGMGETDRRDLARLLRSFLATTQDRPCTP
ncbi:MarR family transcriptional regulator [Nonomuraea turkmeniaca]|uniref:MarR family transcriptional regulator n=1 Tax=Nonomuraea turkmeniaca TaxID=103838 RepID=A0A5S4FKN1_9ACTN|nr:MarR family transcriptional regulator [Nonomuraea turkmeniaca]TMR21286.1 MarR family transcriptional regulator [Nonomuraea turkmeniaca]